MRGKRKDVVEKALSRSSGRRCDCNTGLPSIKLTGTPKTSPQYFYNLFHGGTVPVVNNNLTSIPI